MKKLFLIASCIAPAMVWAQQGNYVLQVKITHINSVAKAHLIYAIGDHSISDSVTAKNGIFEFKGILSEPAIANLQIDHQGEGLALIKGEADMLTFYLDKGNTNIVADDSVKRATIPGSQLNREAAHYSALTKPVQDSMATLYNAFYGAPEEKQKDKAFDDSLTALYDAQAGELLAQRMQFIKNYPDSYVSLITLREMTYQEPDILKLEPVYNLLSPGMKGTSYGKEMAGFISKAKMTAVGVMAPLFSLPDTSGKQVSLQSFRGKYVLLDFWASWCVPCRQENPNVVKAYKRFKDKNFTIVGISLDQPGKKDAWLAAIKADGLDWTQLSDLQYWNNAVVKQYGIRSIPQNYLIDPTGKIVAKNLRGEDLEKELAVVFH